MVNKPLLFAVIALAQLAVPGWMIFRSERIMIMGEQYRFRTAPIDPTDPFRGEYVTLDFEAERGEWDLGLAEEELNGRLLYAWIATDSAGFARIDTLSLLPPTNGQACLKVRSQGSHEGKIKRLSLPFDRYYLEEGDGSRTEDLMAGRLDDLIPDQDPPDNDLPSFALVRVLDGSAVIEDLVVGDRSIHDWLKEEAKQAY